MSSHQSVQKQYSEYISSGGDGNGVLYSRAQSLGYGRTFLAECRLDLENSKTAPLFAASCGSGSPLSLIEGSIKSGSTVLDLGCGACHDVALASRLVGNTGRVIALDMTEKMLVAGMENVKEYANDKETCGPVLFVRAIMDNQDSMEEKVDRNVADIIISNGSINLCIDKRTAFQEAYRTLKVGGTFLLSDLCQVDHSATAQVSCTIGDGWSN